MEEQDKQTKIQVMLVLLKYGYDFILFEIWFNYVFASTLGLKGYDPELPAAFTSTCCTPGAPNLGTVTYTQ